MSNIVVWSGIITPTAICHHKSRRMDNDGHGHASFNESYQLSTSINIIDNKTPNVLARLCLIARSRHHLR